MYSLHPRKGGVFKENFVCA